MEREQLQHNRQPGDIGELCESRINESENSDWGAGLQEWLRNEFGVGEIGESEISDSEGRLQELLGNKFRIPSPGNPFLANLEEHHPDLLEKSGNTDHWETDDDEVELGDGTRALIWPREAQSNQVSMAEVLEL